MDKKYKLTDEFIINSGQKLYRIEALRDFANVKCDEIGGYIESEKNLSQDGDCWVYGDARVYDNALICGNARVLQNARVYENAIVKDNTCVFDYATIHGNAKITSSSVVGGFAEICGNTVLRHERIGGEVIIGKGINDKVNKPSHYAQDDIECIDVILQQCKHLNGVEAYLYGNVQKYIWRFKNKNGIEDLKKAQVYLNWLIEELDNK